LGSLDALVSRRVDHISVARIDRRIRRDQPGARAIELGVEHKLAVASVDGVDARSKGRSARIGRDQAMETRIAIEANTRVDVVTVRGNRTFQRNSAR
jgi:hypothetical protein